MGRRYPYYSGDERLKGGGGGRCRACDKPATHRITIQVSWFRGDDEVLRVCPEHKALGARDPNALFDIINAKALNKERTT